jgi:iron complex outermembrane recepter protein
VSSPVVNSAAEATGGAVGAAIAFADGRGNVGIAQSQYDTRYGTVAEEAVKIDMRQERTAAELSIRGLSGVVESFFVKASRTDYRHVELEEGEIGTTFTNKGRDLRAEFRHAPIGNLRGMVGVQTESFTFSALGDEAFIPRTKTRNQALFLYEELPLAALRLSMGARAERSEVISDGAGSNSPARFGVAESRRFNLASAAVGASWRVTPATRLNANLAVNSRAPTYYELFADGPHIATAAYEVGARNLDKERATAVDINLNWAQRGASLQVGVFAQRFRNFVALRRSGIDRDTEGNANVTDCGDGTSVESDCAAEILPEYRYQGVAAKLTGVELQGTLPLWKGHTNLDLNVKLDAVRAQDRSNQEPLPRIAPLRATIGLALTDEAWKLDLDVMRAAAQRRVPQLDAIGSTAGYTMVNASAIYKWQQGVGSLRPQVSVFLRASNLTNQRAFNAASIDTVRNLSPLPGRSVKAGLRVDF